MFYRIIKNTRRFIPANDGPDDLRVFFTLSQITGNAGCEKSLFSVFPLGKQLYDLQGNFYNGIHSF